MKANMETLDNRACFQGFSHNPEQNKIKIDNCKREIEVIKNGTNNGEKSRKFRSF
jgi:hypothetical protein